MDPREWHAAEWGAFGQVGALVVAIVAGLLVWLQVSQGRQVREDQTRPYVIVDFEFHGQEVMIGIRNIGSTAARDVRFKFDKPIEQGYRVDPDELAIFADGVPMLAPGRSLAIPYGSGPSLFSDESTSPLRYAVDVSYTDLEGKRRYDDPPLVLDLAPFKHTIVEHDDLHQIYQNLKEIKQVMKGWTKEQRLRVNTITQAEIDERNRRLYEERQERRRVANGDVSPVAEDQSQDRWRGWVSRASAIFQMLSRLMFRSPRSPPPM